MENITQEQLIKLIDLRYVGAIQQIKDAVFQSYKKLSIEELELTTDEILALNTGLN